MIHGLLIPVHIFGMMLIIKPVILTVLLSTTLLLKEVGTVVSLVILGARHVLEVLKMNAWHVQQYHIRSIQQHVMVIRLLNIPTWHRDTILALIDTMGCKRQKCAWLAQQDAMFVQLNYCTRCLNQLQVLLVQLGQNMIKMELIVQVMEIIFVDTQ